MYKIFVWSDNQHVQKALAYLYDTGRTSELQPLPSYAFGAIDMFKLHEAMSAYLKYNTLGHFDLRLAMKLDLIRGCKDFDQLARFTSKNIVGEAQVVATTIEGESIVSLAKQYSSALSKEPVSSLTKILPYGAEKARFVTVPSSVAMAAHELKHFMSVTRNKVFKKKEGELLYIDGVHEDDSGGITGLTALGMTYSGYVDGKVDDSMGSGQLIFGGSVKSEIAIVAFFDGTYTAGENKLAFPEEINWYDLIKGAKTGGKKMCTVGDKVWIKSIKGLSLVSGNPTMVELHSTSPHDPDCTLSKGFATYNSVLSHTRDCINLDIACNPETMGAVLAAIASKGGRLGIPCNGDDLVFFADGRTRACIVAKNSSVSSEDSEEKEPPTAKTAEEQIASTKVDNCAVDKCAVDKCEKAEDHAAIELTGLPTITACLLEGEAYSLYIGKKMVAVMPKEVLHGIPVKRFQPISRNAPGVPALIDKVYDVLVKGNGRAMTRHDIAEFMPGGEAHNANSIGSALSALYRRGKIDRPEKALYSVSPT